MNKHLGLAASAATMLLFLGAGCSELPPNPEVEEPKNIETSEVAPEQNLKEAVQAPVAAQSAPAPVQKESPQIGQREREDDENENEDENEREERGTPPAQPQVKPVAPAQAPTPTPAPTVKTYTMAEVQKANNASNCWSVVSGKVYNLTPFTPGHPGGEPAILSMCGKDGTAGFMAQHGGQAKPETVLAKYYLGVLK